eukprot:NODE_392_length_2007_cov_61.223936_g385_i0.p1 GENE.NODE_392_length_2007_cov_61.223936_g385_i0~~NODE_392_length_2007_cov_61.223936_g385_i0.p1  ORF type:complete len:658 (-),score=168.95 NODE_392_length_2007_cov_61.223936_g385_i0:34-1899(-)
MDTLVLCGGQWTRQLAAKIGVTVPLHSAEHYYITTTPMPNVTLDLPVLRDPDAYLYVREWGMGLCVGGFEPQALPIWSDGVPQDFKFGLLPENWDQFGLIYEGAVERIPSLDDAQVRTFVNGPESFTPDNHYIMGAAPEVKNVFVCAGMNSSGIASAGGAGMALAEWIVDGQPRRPLFSMDIRRFGHYAKNIRYLRERTAETLGMHYRMPWPRFEAESSRKVRMTPLYDRLQKKNARFGQKFGWERPVYFVPEGVELPKSTEDGYYTYDRPVWQEFVDAEVNHTRNNVSVFDMSSFSKYIVQGDDALGFMQRMCCANLDVPVGKLVYTGMLNHKGGYEADVTVTRTGRDSFYIVSATAQATRDAAWLAYNRRDGERVTLTDVTAQYNVLAVMGPRSRDLLSSVCEGVDFSNEAFPFATSQTIGVGYGMADAKRITYVGELGWELHVTADMSQQMYDALMETAGTTSLKDGGYYAIEAMRLEKGYRAWGHELDEDTTPLEAGLGFTVDWNKDFLGRDALVKQRAAGINQRIVSARTVGTDVQLWGDETVCLNGSPVGRMTSATWSATLGSSAGMALLQHPDVGKKGWLAKQKEWTVEVHGKSYAAAVGLRPFVDPKSAKILC